MQITKIKTFIKKTLILSIFIVCAHNNKAYTDVQPEENTELKTLSPQELNSYLSSQNEYFESMDQVVNKEHLDNWSISDTMLDADAAFEPEQYDSFNYIKSNCSSASTPAGINTDAAPDTQFNFEQFQKTSKAVENESEELQTMAHDKGFSQ